MNPEPNLQPTYFFSYPNLYSLLFPTNPELNFLPTSYILLLLFQLLHSPIPWLSLHLSIPLFSNIYFQYIFNISIYIL